MNTYPKREAFFANRFIRLLTRSCLALRHGPEGFTLLAVVVMTEDVRRYSGPAMFYNPNLADQVGISVDKLARVRGECVAAGWLNYEPGTRGKPGAYWVSIPANEDGIPDAPSDESDGLSTVVSSAGSGSNQGTNEFLPLGAEPYADRTADRTAEPSYPTPTPKDNATSPTKSKPTKKPKPAPEPEPTLPFSSDAFREAWAAWQRHRKEIGKPLKATATERQLMTLAAMGESRAIAALDHSMANGWQGIFEPDAKPTQRGAADDEDDYIRRCDERRTREARERGAA